MNTPEIDNVTVRYMQEGNTLGTTDDYESITIDLEFQLDEKTGPFVVIKTDGWSFDEIDELEELVNRTKNILKMNMPG